MEFEEEKVKSDGDELCGLIELAIAERNRMKLHKHISDMLAIDADHEILPLAKEYMRAFAIVGKVKLALKHNDLALAKRSVGETFANMEECYSHKGVKDYIKKQLVTIQNGFMFEYEESEKDATIEHELESAMLSKDSRRVNNLLDEIRARDGKSALVDKLEQYMRAVKNLRKIENKIAKGGGLDSISSLIDKGLNVLAKELDEPILSWYKHEMLALKGRDFKKKSTENEENASKARRHVVAAVAAEDVSKLATALADLEAVQPESGIVVLGHQYLRAMKAIRKIELVEGKGNMELLEKAFKKVEGIIPSLEGEARVFLERRLMVLAKVYHVRRERGDSADEDNIACMSTLTPSSIATAVGREAERRTASSSSKSKE